MKILVIDDDQEDTPQLCDLLQIRGHTVSHICESEDIEKELRRFKPDGIILDIMMPPPEEVAAHECAAGYTTGAYVYMNIVHPNAPTTPFVVWTGADVRTSLMKETLKELGKYTTYCGCVEKGRPAIELVEALEAGQTVGPDPA